MPDETVAPILRWLKRIFWVACAGFLVSVANSTANYRSKSITEERLDVLEAARQDQQRRNIAQDEFNRILIDREKTR